MSASTVSRWETAKLPAPYYAIRRYERVLNLSPGLLTATIDTVNRYWSRHVTHLPKLRRDIDVAAMETYARLDRLLDLACSTSEMTGGDWDELTSLLSAIPRAFVPSKTWIELTSRLLLEQTVADGVPWFQRFEAFNRLLGHPIAQHFAVAACATLAADGSNQIVAEAMSSLDCSDHPSASYAVMAQLEDPVTERAQQGALMASVRKFRYHHFTDDQAQRIVRVLNDVIRGAPEPRHGN